MSKWFICQDEVVSGPFKEEDLKGNQEIAEDALVWGHPLNAWVKFSLWSTELNNIKDEMQERRLKKQIMWHFAVNKKSYGPFPRPQLLDELSKLDHTDRVLIWTKGYENWVSIYECHDILNDLGINRRKAPRALITGHVVIKKDDFSVIAQLRTIGPGGFGTSVVEGLKQGEVYDVEIRTSELHNNVSCQCEARFISERSVGFKFKDIHIEAQIAITDYVKSVPASKAA